MFSPKYSISAACLTANNGVLRAMHSSKVLAELLNTFGKTLIFDHKLSYSSLDKLILIFTDISFK